MSINFATTKHIGYHGGLQPIPVDRVSKSLNVVMGWQEAELPSRFAIGGGELRKLTIRVRQQPVNFMVIVHQSLVTAGDGQGLCRRGLKASGVLLEEQSRREGVKEEFATTTIEEIKEYASDLKEHTNGMKNKFRQLRVAVFDLHQQSNAVASKRERGNFFTQISRHLNKDIRTSEDTLKQVQEDLEEIENSLSLIIQWWQTVQSEVNHLQMSGNSLLEVQRNAILLEEIKSKFLKLDTYFADYLDKMAKIYDANLTSLNDNNQRYLKKIQDSADLTLSKKGLLEPERK